MINSLIKWLKEWHHYLESSRMGIGIPDDYREDWHFCYLCIWEGQQNVSVDATEIFSFPIYPIWVQRHIFGVDVHR